MTIRSMIEGLTILEKYFGDAGGGYHLGACHDVVYVHPTHRPVGADDLKRLVELGWSQENAKYDRAKGFGVEDYDLEEGWTAYV